MIDSICLSQELHPRLSERELRNIGAKRPKGRTAYVINPAANQAMPALTWQTHPARGHPNGVQYLSARFSLPRQRWGHNARLPVSYVDIFAELGIAAYAIYRATGIRFNPLNANVTDVHYAMDFRVGTERVRPILDRLETRRLPKYKPIRFPQGVEFKQKQSSIQIYAKFFEVKEQLEKGHILPEHHYDALQASEGVLRVECKQHLPAIERSQSRQGMRRVASDVLTPDTSNRIIADALEKLQFEDAVKTAAVDGTMLQLIERLGVHKAMRAYGFLGMVNFFGPDFFRVIDFPRRTYYDNLRLCKAADLWAMDK